MSTSKKNEEISKSAGNPKSVALKWAALTATALLIGVSTVLAFNIPGLGKSEKVTPVNGTVIIPLAKVSDGKAHFYRLADGDKEIGFFVVKGSDGAIHTAIDACDVCFREKKGYSQEGNFMICRNCNKKFPVAKIGPNSGTGCNPSHLSFFEDGKNVVIKVADLKPGERFF